MLKISFIVTILLQSLLVLNLKLLDNIYLIFSLFSALILIGLFLKIVFKKSNLQQIGRGILFGSLTSLSLTIIFLIWLSYNFPK
jgi:Na+/phosphate symporter